MCFMNMEIIARDSGTHSPSYNKYEDYLASTMTMVDTIVNKTAKIRKDNANLKIIHTTVIRLGNKYDFGFINSKTLTLI